MEIKFLGFGHEEPTSDFLDGHYMFLSFQALFRYICSFVENFTVKVDSFKFLLMYYCSSLMCFVYFFVVMSNCIATKQRTLSLPEVAPLFSFSIGLKVHFSSSSFDFNLCLQIVLYPTHTANSRWVHQNLSIVWLNIICLFSLILGMNYCWF
jgi:hypothetical protein